MFHRMDGPRRRPACGGSDAGCILSRTGRLLGVGGRASMLHTLLLFSAFGLLLGLPAITGAKECDKPCMNGQCNTSTGSCVCSPGWVGDQCQHCGGRFRLTGPSGFLTDGPGNYKYKTKCTWLIEGTPNSILRLRLDHFATECSWDHLYVYDGDSIYTPLLAAFRWVQGGRWRWW
uniref:CUB domain-containing protein n=1 Tax=Hucho hucho TaxID=62062 RepID=A0A4W5LBB0_9TELE